MSDQRESKPESIGDLVRKVVSSFESPEGQAATEHKRRQLEEIKRDRAERQEPDAVRRLRHLNQERGIPLRFIHATGDVGRSTKSLEAVRRFMGLRSPWLVLAGGPGIGKSFAAAWVIAQDCPDHYLYGWRSGGAWPAEMHPRFVDVTRFARMDRYDDAVMAPYEQCSVLAIDDLGVEYADPKGSWLTTLEGLLNARYANALRTVMTTNLGAMAFKGRYGERISSRIREMGEFLEIRDTDLRAKP